MTSPVRRAGAFAALCTLSLVVPLFGPVAGGAVAAAVLLGAFVLTDGPLFDLLALPGDYEEGRLYGLITFVLAAAALGLLAANSSMPVSVFVGTVVLVGYGALAAELARTRTDDAAVRAGAFCLGGAAAATAGQMAALAPRGEAVAAAVPAVAFLAVAGVLLAALLRNVLIRDDDPIVMLSVGLLLWLLAALDPAPGALGIAVAVLVTVAFGYLSYALETASVAGMLTGILLGLLTIVLGGYGWFVVLLSFFAIGGLSTKFRYEQKERRGVAEDNDGARGSGNVLGNAAVAIAAVLAYAASDAALIPGDPDLFLFAFAGSVATALSDTLSSEIGGVFDQPRLITTLEPVDPGTDGGVTWQGELAGMAGALVVAAISFGWFPAVDAVSALVVVAAGVAGMTVDSLLGATIEGDIVGNQAVNFLATFSGAVVAAALAVALAVG